MAQAESDGWQVPTPLEVSMASMVPTASDPSDRTLPVDEESARPELQGVRFRLPEQGSSEMSDWIKDAWSSSDNRSLWRYPSKPGSMPEYLCRAFRIKTFSLMTLQLAVVFSLMVTVDHYQIWSNVLSDPRQGHFQDVGQEVIFYSAGFATLLCIMAMFCLKERFPLNYWLMAVTTVMSGMFWGMTRAVVQTTMHFQIVAILFCSMLGATVASQVLQKQRGPKLLILSLAPGWALGASCNVLVSRRYLLHCKPDDFMKVVVSMDSTLMVVVSIPFFVLSFCFIHTGEAVIEDEQEQEVAQVVREDRREQEQPAPRAVGNEEAAWPPIPRAQDPEDLIAYRV
eukprot:g21721.t1